MNAKKLLSVLLLPAAMFFGGCSTSGGIRNLPVQKILTAALPPDFTGDAKLYHKNPYFDLDMSFTGLKKNAAGVWTWTGFSYVRNGRFSNANITLTPTL